MWHISIRDIASLLLSMLLLIAPLPGCGDKPQPPQMQFEIINEKSILEASTGKLCFSFRLLNPEGGLVSDVTDFQYQEDAAEISKFESAVRPLDLFTPYTYTLILLDLSGGVVKSGNLDTLKEITLELLRSAPVDKVNPQTGAQTAIYTFDGSRDLRSKQIITFTNALPELEAAIGGIDVACMQDCATNLHGAVMKGLDILEQRAGKGTYGARLIVISDFRHSAGVDGADYPSLEAVTARIKSSRYSFFALGLGPELNEETMKAIGRDGAHKANGSIRSLMPVFDRWHTKNQHYQICYCSPARAGDHTFTIKAKQDSLEGTYSHPFRANMNFAHCRLD